LEQIEDTWFGSYKLRANISKFNRGEVKPKLGPKLPEERVRREDGRTGEINQGVSFKEILGVEVGVHNRSQEPLKFVSGGDKQQNPFAVMDDAALIEKIPVEACPTSLRKLNQSFVGTLKNGFSAENIQVVIDMEGFQSVKATLLGFDKVLLSSCIEDGVAGALQADRTWWDDKFLEIVKWNPKLKTEGRRIWVRIFGIPLHTWGWDCFQRIVNSFGRLVSLDVQTENQSRLDVARVQVVVSTWDFLNKSVAIIVGSDLFEIKVVEERFGDVDLETKRCSDSDQFCDVSVEGGGQSQTPSIEHGTGGSEDGGSRWEEGWSEKASEEPL
jgi:hypothetical protein